MSLPNSNTAPQAGEYAGDEIAALVLDPGSFTTRAGFAGEDCPKSVIPTSYSVLDGKPIYGENALHDPIPNLDVRNPYNSEGIVEDWDVAKQLWEYAITSRLTGPKQSSAKTNGLNDTSGENGAEMDVDMENGDAEKALEDSPVLITEPGWNPTRLREKIVEVAMEDWGTPAFYLGRSGVLAAFAAGKHSALCVDVGASTVSVTPVLDGMIIKKAVMKSPLAGNFLSSQIRLMYQQQPSPVPLTPHYMVQSKTPVDAGAPSQATYKKFDTPPSESFRRNEEDRVLQEFKETVVQVWHSNGRLTSSGNEESAKASPGRPFEMPDGWNQVFGLERFKVAEGMFDAKAAFTSPEAPRPAESSTIPALIQASLNNVDIEQRPLLLSHVVVTGGTSLTYGFNDRLLAELTAMFPAPRIRISSPGSTVERKYAPWIGGSILASLGSFHQMWISKKEYEEHGSSIVEKRCK